MRRTLIVALASLTTLAGGAALAQEGPPPGRMPAPEDIFKRWDTYTGKFGKYFERHLEPEEWDTFVRTFPDGQYDRIWEALLTMTDLFRSAAQEVAGCYGYVYPSEDDRRISDYIRRVRILPRSAGRIY